MDRAPCREKVRIPKSSATPRPSGCHATAILMFPTRELAMQVHDALIRLQPGHHLLVQAKVSQSPYPTTEDPSRHYDVIVGTPGKILGAVEKGGLRLDSVKYYMFDEVHDLLGDTGAGCHCRTLCQRIPQDTGARIVTSSSRITPVMERFCLRGIEPRIHLDAMARGNKAFLRAVELENHESRSDALTRFIASRPSAKNIVIFTDTLGDAQNVHDILREKLPDRVVALMNKESGTQNLQTLLCQFQREELDIIVTCRLFYAGIELTAKVTSIIFYKLLSVTWPHAIGARLRINRPNGEVAVIVDPNAADDMTHYEEFRKWLRCFGDNDTSVSDRNSHRPSLNPGVSPGCKLIIRGLAPEVTAGELEAALQQYSPVRAEVGSLKTPKSVPTAFIHFASAAHALECVKQIDGARILGAQVQAGFALEKK
ncbi:P-loop containing nucleoside triphosphate hydrolase protein [Aspergillus minisclerotigenes]|uniref:RNA helicase n=1 Tax=Aspergillus minisclerotigenes TaxID=656917 RepID=A0A5N6IWW4_9EURO|nr:P-loop containing nucleoside triphosphate hydrolase protein [Aspergillus minisclerotigenes]